MQRCYHRECDTARLRVRDRSLDQEPDYSFLALTVQTLVKMTGRGSVPTVTERP